MFRSLLLTILDAGCIMSPKFETAKLVCSALKPKRLRNDFGYFLDFCAKNGTIVSFWIEPAAQTVWHKVNAKRAPQTKQPATELLSYCDFTGIVFLINRQTCVKFIAAIFGKTPV